MGAPIPIIKFLWCLTSLMSGRIRRTVESYREQAQASAADRHRESFHARPSALSYFRHAF